MADASAPSSGPVDGSKSLMIPPLSPPFKNYTYRSREEAFAENDSDYDTDEERKKFQYELLKDEFPECYMPIPRGIPETCFACKGPVVVRAESGMGRTILECDKKEAGFTRHYRRWWDEAIVEELNDLKKEVNQLKGRVDLLEKINIA